MGEGEGEGGCKIQKNPAEAVKVKKGPCKLKVSSAITFLMVRPLSKLRVASGDGYGYTCTNWLRLPRKEDRFRVTVRVVIVKSDLLRGKR